MDINMKMLFLSCILSMVLVNCKPGTSLHNSDEVVNDKVQQAQILFINFTLTQDSISGKLSAELVNFIISKGRLKEPTKSKRSAETGDLAFVLLSENQVQVKEIIFDNPLNKRVEYVDNDGNLATKQLKLHETSHFLRLQLVEGGAAFKIQEITNSAKKSRNDLLQVNL